MTNLQSPGCACCAPPFIRSHATGRRAMLGLAAGLIGVAALPRTANAKGIYDSMLLTCIDPRFVSPVGAWMDNQGLKGMYSHFAIAGAAVGVVAPNFATWSTAFWDNLGASIHLHSIKRVIVVGHRDCGAAKIAYGAETVANPETETALHRRVFGEFTTQLAAKQPSLGIACGLMALDGTVERFA